MQYYDVNETKEILGGKLSVKSLVALSPNTYTLPDDNQDKKVLRNLGLMLYHSDNCVVEINDMFGSVAYRISKYGNGSFEIVSMNLYKVELGGIISGRLMLPLVMPQCLHKLMQSYIEAHFENLV